jgi:hypothetical protein
LFTVRVSVTQYNDYATSWITEKSWFDSRQGIFLFSKTSILALWPTQYPIQWVEGALSKAVKRPGSEADHTHLVPTLKMSAATSPLSHMTSWRLHRDNSTFTVKSVTSLRFEVSDVFISYETIRSRSSVNVENTYKANWTMYG